jgi:antitoxin VapB
MPPEPHLTQTAKIFINGRSQAVRLPAAFPVRYRRKSFIRQDPLTGDVILSRKPDHVGWVLHGIAGRRLSPEDFLNEAERAQG